jgi:hypothetical protein
MTEIEKKEPLTPQQISQLKNKAIATGFIAFGVVLATLAVGWALISIFIAK